MPSYTLKKQYSSNNKEPKKVNLKLPIPNFLHSGYSSEKIHEQNNSLPTIKKLAIPIKFLKNNEKRRDRSP